MWYFPLPEGSITSWIEIQTMFLDKFGEDKIVVVLVLKLSRIKMDNKEKVEDFHKIFLSLRNKILGDSMPIEGVVIKFYSFSLPQTMAMFVK